MTFSASARRSRTLVGVAAERVERGVPELRPELGLSDVQPGRVGRSGPAQHQI